MTDQTLNDINRRELTFSGNVIKSALPEYFIADHPQLITLLEKYYTNLDSAGNIGDKLKALPKSRDIGQTSKANLTRIEDELLLGQNYLEGILDTRTGAELSNNFYRSKGTKYGIQRFFRAFYGIDPDIIYGKDLIFNIGETIIGPNSGKFILNDKIYQYFGLLLKVSLPSSEWIDLYKLFAHPGGMYIGTEVQIVGVNEDLGFDCMPLSTAGTGNLILSAEGTITTSPSAAAKWSVSGIITDSAGVDNIRIDLQKSTLEKFVDSDGGADSDQFGTLLYMDNQHKSLRDVMLETSETFDEDSAGIGAVDMSNTIITMDANEFSIYDSSA